MQKKNNKLIFSPSDLTTFFKSPFASWMNRFCLENPSEKFDFEEDPTMKLLAAKGDEHERAYLKQLKSKYPDLVEIEKKDFQVATAQTIASMKSGASVIYQGAMQVENFLGYSDFLIKREGTSKLGRFYYEAWDTKLARHTKPEYLLQLCSYSEMLNSIQGVWPNYASIILGDQTQENFCIDDFIHYYRRIKERFQSFHREFDSNRRPLPQVWEDFGNWEEYAEQILKERDHLSLVAGVSIALTKKLEDAGIKTFAELAESIPTKPPESIRKDIFERICKQAYLQKLSEEKGKTQFEYIRREDGETPYGLKRLPPLTQEDVYFDMEGYPLAEDGLEYLFGAIFVKNEKPEFIDWWATDKTQEKKAFEEWVDWVFKWWKKNPKMHIFHYASYEVTAMKKLMGEHMTRAYEIDELLRNKVFVDLYQIVKESIIVGAPSYSIKKLEDLYDFKREGDVKSAGDSVIQFAEWLDLQDGHDWKSSKILKLIRDYNEEDCVSTLRLTKWLRDLQMKEKIKYMPLSTSEEDDNESDRPMKEHEELSCELRALLPSDKSVAQVQEVLAEALGYYDREKKPQWWAYFDRLSLHTEDLIDDYDCLADCHITNKTSSEIHVSFSPLQETKMSIDSSFLLHHAPKISGTITAIDLAHGTAILSIKKSADLPPSLTLIPIGPINTKPIEESIYETVLDWGSHQDLQKLKPALRDLLCRSLPRINGHKNGDPIITDQRNIVEQTCVTCLNLENSVLAIQGPPGTGKTYTASHVIASLIINGKKIGVISTGHKAINLVMIKTFEVLKGMKKENEFKAIKVRSEVEDELMAAIPCQSSPRASDFWKKHRDFNLVGGTQWFFSHKLTQNQFDYLFIEEAGQFSIASTIAVQRAAKNLVLLGDQMQLEQPIQGTHPDLISQSVLSYYLENHATVPPEKGVFLGVSRRMRPEVCSFISDAVYEGKLHSHPDTQNNKIELINASAIEKSAGVLFISVAHEGDTQSSDEEVAKIVDVIKSLKSSNVTEVNHSAHNFTLNDCLFVAPYNVQVGLLQNALGESARVGSVDLFQGQEAPIVFFSMCSSNGDLSPRGLDFLLNKNRINVAISRAKTLAIVVGNPALADKRITSVNKMRQVSLFCRIMEESEKCN